MSHSFKKNVQTTRRILLQTAIGAVSAVSFLGSTARGARAAKSSKSDVVYQDSPKGNQQCDGCRLQTGRGRHQPKRLVQDVGEEGGLERFRPPPYGRVGVR